MNEYFLYQKEVKLCNHILLWFPFVYELQIIAYGFLGINWVMAGLVRKEIWA